jgi:hypothetical protein
MQVASICKSMKAKSLTLPLVITTFHRTMLTVAIKLRCDPLFFFQFIFIVFIKN